MTGKGDYERLGIGRMGPVAGFSRNVKQCIQARKSLLRPIREAITMASSAELNAYLNKNPYIIVVICSAPVYMPPAPPIHPSSRTEQFYFPDGFIHDAFVMKGKVGRDKAMELRQEAFIAQKEDMALTAGFQITQTVQFYSATRNPYVDIRNADIMQHTLTCSGHSHPVYMNKLQIKHTHADLLKLKSLYRDILQINKPREFAEAHGLGMAYSPLYVGVFVDVRERKHAKEFTVGLQYPLLESIQAQCQSLFVEDAVNLLITKHNRRAESEDNGIRLLTAKETSNYADVAELELSPLAPNLMSVLSYNVSWQSLECVAPASSCCTTPGTNECTPYIGMLIAEGMKGELLDFVAMQEIRPDREKQWPALALQIDRYAPGFQDKYEPLFATPEGTAGIMLLYHRVRYIPRHQVVGDFLRPSDQMWAAIKARVPWTDVERQAIDFDAQTRPTNALSDVSGRPYQIVFFEGLHPLIFINVHMPHRSEMRKVKVPYPPHTADLWNVRFEEIMTATIRIELEKLGNRYGDQGVDIVMCGDFNRDPATFINGFADERIRGKLTGPRDAIRTCCVQPDDPPGKKYKYAFDHVYTTFGPTMYYKAMYPTKPDDPNKRITCSDHLPVIAQFRKKEFDEETNESRMIRDVPTEPKDMGPAEFDEIEMMSQQLDFIGMLDEEDEAQEGHDEDEVDWEDRFVMQPMLRPILTTPILREVFCNAMFGAIISRPQGMELDIANENHLVYLFLSLAGALVDTKVPGAFLNTKAPDSLFSTWHRIVACGLNSMDRYRKTTSMLRARLDSLPKYGIIPRFYRIMQNSSGSVNYYLRFLPRSYDVRDLRGAVGVLDTRPGNAKRVTKYMQIILDQNIPHFTGVLVGEDIDTLIADDTYGGIIPETTPEYVLTNMVQRFVHVFFNYLFKTRPWINITLYRGVNANETFPIPKVGEHIREDGIMYATFNFNHVDMYLTRENKMGSNATPYLLQFTNAHIPCTLNYGDLLLYDNPYYQEFEIILPPGTTYSVDSQGEVKHNDGNVYPVLYCTLLNIDSGWVTQPYAPMADKERGKQLYLDNDRVLQHIASDATLIRAFARIDRTHKNLVGFVNENRAVVKQCTAFIESLGSKFTQPQGTRGELLLTDKAGNHYAHTDLVNVTKVAGEPFIIRPTNASELSPAYTFIYPEQPFMPLTKMQVRRMQRVVRVPGVEAKAREVRRRQREVEEGVDGEDAARRARKVTVDRKIQEFAEPTYAIKSGQKVTDGRRTGVVRFIEPRSIQRGVDMAMFTSGEGVQVGTEVTAKGGRKATVLGIDETAETYDIEFSAMAFVQFTDPLGQTGDNDMLRLSELRPVTDKIASQSFIVMLRFPIESMDEESWSRINDKAGWLKFVSRHPNIAIYEVVADEREVASILTIKGFVTRNEMVKSIVDAFPITLVDSPHIITDANLGLGKRGFSLGNPSNPTLEELQHLFKKHGATWRLLPMVITQEMRDLYRWSQFHEKVNTRRYTWEIIGKKKRESEDDFDADAVVQTKLPFKKLK